MAAAHWIFMWSPESFLQTDLNWFGLHLKLDDNFFSCGSLSLSLQLQLALVVVCVLISLSLSDSWLLFCILFCPSHNNNNNNSAHGTKLSWHRKKQKLSICQSESSCCCLLCSLTSLVRAPEPEPEKCGAGKLINRDGPAIARRQNPRWLPACQLVNNLRAKVDEVQVHRRNKQLSSQILGGFVVKIDSSHLCIHVLSNTYCILHPCEQQFNLAVWVRAMEKF